MAFAKAKETKFSRDLNEVLFDHSEKCWKRLCANYRTRQDVEFLGRKNEIVYIRKKSKSCDLKTFFRKNNGKTTSNLCSQHSFLDSVLFLSPIFPL